MRFARRISALVLPSAVVACRPAQAARDDVRFEVRGLTVRSEDATSYMSFTHEATLLAHGDSSASLRPYLVMLSVERKSGGGPDLAARFTEPVYVTTPVVGGVGELEFSGGLRDRKTSFQEAETWEPMQIDVRVVGHIPITPAGTAVAAAATP